MGTRGLAGFRSNGQDKFAYNHWSSEPTCLGIDVATFVQSCTKAELLRASECLIVVDGKTLPTPEQIAECAPWTDLSVSNQSTDDWYCLTRNAQGNLQAYVDGLKYMVASNAFIKDSLFCEWAYAIDTDTDTLEVYKGFQTVLGDGRYNSEYPKKKNTEELGEYTGCKLIQSIPCETLRAMDPSLVHDLMHHIESLDYVPDEDDEHELVDHKAAIEKLLNGAPTAASDNVTSAPADPLLTQANELIAGLVNTLLSRKAQLSEEQTKALAQFVSPPMRGSDIEDGFDPVAALKLFRANLDAKYGPPTKPPQGETPDES